MPPCRGRPGGRGESPRAPAGRAGAIARRASQPSARPSRAAVRRARATVRPLRRTPRRVRNAHCPDPMRAICGDRFVHGEPPTRRLRRSPSTCGLRRADNARGHSRSRFPPEVGATVSTSMLRASSAKALHTRSVHRRKPRARESGGGGPCYRQRNTRRAPTLYIIPSVSYGARRGSMLSAA